MLSTYQAYHAVKEYASRSVPARVQSFSSRSTASDNPAKRLPSILNGSALRPTCQLIILMLLKNN